MIRQPCPANDNGIDVSLVDIDDGTNDDDDGDGADRKELVPKKGPFSIRLFFFLLPR